MGLRRQLRILARTARWRSLQVLLRRGHVVELLADLRQSRLQLIDRVMQRLHLRRHLIDFATLICGGGLQRM